MGCRPNTSTFNTFLPTGLFIDAYDYNYGSGQFVTRFDPVQFLRRFLGNQRR